MTMNDHEDATAVPIAAWKGVPVSRHVRLVCKPSIAALFVRRSIGQRTKKYVENVPPSYTRRRYSRTLPRRRTVPFASYLCHLD
jgi:hypothetical protein